MPGCLHGTCHQPWQCICHSGWAGKFCDKGESLAVWMAGSARDSGASSNLIPMLCFRVPWLKSCTDRRDGTARSHVWDASLGCFGCPQLHAGSSVALYPSAVIWPDSAAPPCHHHGELLLAGTHSTGTSRRPTRGLLATSRPGLLVPDERKEGEGVATFPSPLGLAEFGN